MTNSVIFNKISILLEKIKLVTLNTLHNACTSYSCTSVYISEYSKIKLV